MMNTTQPNDGISLFMFHRNYYFFMDFLSSENLSRSHGKPDVYNNSNNNNNKECTILYTIKIWKK